MWLICNNCGWEYHCKSLEQGWVYISSDQCPACLYTGTVYPLLSGIIIKVQIEDDSKPQELEP